MKSLKAQFIGAIAMVLVAAIAMGSSTYAWFAMNSSVTATGMKVKAVAEDGIVIANVTQAAWTTSESANYTSVAGLKPISTSDAANWYHNVSDDVNDHTASEAYVDKTASLALSDTTNSEGVGYTNDNATSGYQADGDSAYYLLSKYFIKSSGGVIDSTLYLNQITVESKRAGVDSALTAIDASLRVAVVVGSGVSASTFIYAPVTSVSTGTGTISPTFSYTVNGSDAVTACNPTAATSGGSGSAAYAAGKNISTGITQISNEDASAVPVSVYVYFEGEDANCKSVNISGIPVNDLEVSVQFGLTTIA